jgi:hypothetical protein
MPCDLPAIGYSPCSYTSLMIMGTMMSRIRISFPPSIGHVAGQQRQRGAVRAEQVDVADLTAEGEVPGVRGEHRVGRGEHVRVDRVLRLPEHVLVETQPVLEADRGRVEPGRADRRARLCSHSAAVMPRPTGVDFGSWPLTVAKNPDACAWETIALVSAGTRRPIRHHRSGA